MLTNSTVKVLQNLVIDGIQKGTEIIYTAESRALAMAEVAVHLTLATMPSDYVMIEIEIPDNIKIKEIESKDLPGNWNYNPPANNTQKIGDDFIDSVQARA